MAQTTEKILNGPNVIKLVLADAVRKIKCPAGHTAFLSVN